uniref:Putative dna polymerase v n=1 Tax=Culex tarsalis TaxID=7177 RepID=A0A1Q3EX66_CULTA
MIPVASPGKATMDKAVFRFFDKFTSADEQTRVRGACELISFLTSEPEKKEKERSYALKRLIRGVGSNTNASRAGYFTALVGYLEQVKDTEFCPGIMEIFGLVKSELSDSDKEGEDEDKQAQLKMELRIGKISVCGAIIGTGLIEGASDLELQTVLKTLKKGMHKAATPLAIMYLSELVRRIDTKKFTSVLWPVVEPKLNVPKEQQTMDTIYFLLAATSAHKKSVNKQFFQNNFDSPRMFHESNYPFLANLLWDIKSTVTINHPLYDYLVEQLVEQEKVASFWTHGVEPILKDDSSEHKFKDIVALRVLITILNRLKALQCLPELLSPGLLEMVLRKTKNFTQLSEDVRELYQEAFDALIQCYPKLSDEQCKLQVFERLVSAPSSILIEKYASNKVIQNLLATLNGESVQKAAQILRNLILSDSEAILNQERIHATQALQKLLYNRHVLAENEWRLGHIKFFLNMGVFYSADGQKILKSSKNQSALSSELVPMMKSSFFHCLEQRHSKLADEKTFLLSIVEYVHGILEGSGVKTLRVPLSDEHLQHWHRMYKIVHGKPKQQNQKLSTVFHILVLYMGLHLFSDPELAASSIAELESVMKRVQGKKSAATSSKLAIKQNGTDAAEPEWIEVVVDLFLNLMSQNSHLLRKVIGHVFPHLSSELTLTAFNQILSVINLKDKTNPLSVDEKGGAEAEQDSKMDTDEEAEDDDDTSGVESDGGESDDKSSESEEEEEDDDDEDEDEFSDDEDGEKVTDKMRLAIQQALGGANPETDTESVDLDDMNEEEGRKLDEALAAAFKMFKQSKKTKPTKAEERVETTLTHFRMRVFDLIDIYLKNSPNIIICLELMLYIFEMLPVAIKETKHKQILDRYRQIFNNLTKIKQFNIDVKDVSAEQLPQILTDLMEKVAKGSSFPDRNQYLLKACQFIVICSQLIEKDSPANKKHATIDQVFCKYLKEFIVDRNPPLTTNVFQTLFRMGWSGNWLLAKTLAEDGLKKDTRIVRRTQTLQLLKELMKNRRFINADPELSAKTLKPIASHLATYLEERDNSTNISQNEFSELLQLLLELKNFQQQHSKTELINWKRTGAQIQKLRRSNLNSQTMNHYVRLCRLLQLEPIKNSQNKQQNGSAKQNGKAVANGVSKKDDGSDASESEDNEEDEDDEEEEQKPTSNGAVKRKKKHNSAKQKRLKKEERLKAASEGLETVSFVNVE